MKLQNMLLVLAPLALASYGAAALAQGADRGLIRIRPGDEAPQPSAGAEGFDAAAWRVLLGESDLDEREASYERLVERALQDERAREFLGELAADGGQPEFAWTARLALREVEARGGRFLGQGPGLGQGLRIRGGMRLPGGLAPPSHPMNPLRHPSRLGRLLEGLGPDLGLFAFPDPGDWEELQRRLEEEGSNGRSEGRSVRIEQGPDGWVLHIVETRDGEEQTREYAGESLDEILEANPELRDELSHVGVHGLGVPGGFRLEFEPHGLFEAPGLLDLDFGGGHLFRWESEGDGPEQGRSFFSKRGPSRPVRTDVLGVRVGPMPADRARELGFGDAGLHVDSVYPGTLAHILGLGSGDVLLRLNGRALESADDITAEMRLREKDAELVLEWIDALGERRKRTWRPGEPGTQTRDF